MYNFAKLSIDIYRCQNKYNHHFKLFDNLQCMSKDIVDQIWVSDMI